MTIISPQYEIWQQSHPESHFTELPIELSQLNKSGALVDVIKMEQVNREYLSRLSNTDLYQECLIWAQAHHADFAALLLTDAAFMQSAIAIERHTPKDPKRFVRYVDVYDQLQCFDDALFADLAYPDVSEKISFDDAAAFLQLYKDDASLAAVWEDFIDPFLDWDGYSTQVQVWFGALRELGQSLGFAINNKQFKNEEFQ